MDPKRLHFLDGLRIAALGLLIVYHVGMYYVSWGWHVKSPFASDAAEPLMLLSSPWRMSLLFLISGAVTALVMPRARPGWLRARMARLGLPLLAGMFLVVPPQSYFQVVEQAGYGGDYLHFLGLYLQGDHGFCDAQGDCLRLPTWNHLWFLPYLMLYTLLLAGALRLAPHGLDRAADWLRPRLSALTLVLLPLAGLAAARLLVRPWFDMTHALVDDLLAHVQYLPAFAIGALWARTPGAWAAVARLRWPVLAAALGAWILVVWGEALPLPLLRIAYVTQQWCGVLAAVGFGVRHLDADGPWRRRWSAAVFPVYVLHQTLIVCGAVALRPLGLPPLVEAPLLAAGTLAAAVGLYLALRPWNVLRPWFGITPDPSLSAAPPAAAPVSCSGR